MQEESKQALWSARLREHAESGQTIRSWCALNGVTESSFHYWRKRLMTATSPATQLVALPFASSCEPMLELETPHGYVIRLRSQAQVGWLGAVLAALR
ncbi:IS66 family insertion sequence element accessory protein TnpA [Noviherbaspirillum sedimenti]|uniref:IS66 family insertion sequence element accessory protein TnpB n=1 Tax=Noviherbaspirillum sedimenti TaxID=2320865 RepID=A0A3A3G0Z1_9BURK|nr:hypothetical protein [Noviherbaspirillum sedimenti]RJG02117.1 hypothetical protein D3878_11450 [Noviherbaspirillum sedimenti]